MKDLKFDVRHHGEMINRLTKEVNAMIPKINDFEGFFGDIRRGMMLFNGYFTQV